MAVSTAEEIKEQLQEVLIKVAEFQNISNFEIHLESAGNDEDGFFGEFYKGEVRNKDTGEVTSVGIKKSPSSEYDYNKTYTNEFLFYQTAYPVLDDFQKEAGVLEPFDHVPRYFCGSLESKREYLAMENLQSLGYVMHDKTQYLNKEHLEKLFNIYAKFHAISYVLQKKDLRKFQNATKDFYNLLPERSKEFGHLITLAISSSVNSLDSKEDKFIYDEIKDLRENVLENFISSFTYNGKYRVLLHGDCWSNNMLFKYAESGKLLDIKLLDFQLTQVGSPIYDLSYFFYSGGSKQDFDNLNNYLQLYYTSFLEFAKELGANVDEILSLEELKNEWKENASFGVFLAILVWAVKFISKEKILDVGKTEQQDLNSDEFLEKARPILRHAFEYGIINKNNIRRKV